YAVPVKAYATYTTGQQQEVTTSSVWAVDNAMFTIGSGSESGKVGVTEFAEVGAVGNVKASYSGVTSAQSVATMVAAKSSDSIGSESAYKYEIAVIYNPVLSFRGSAVVDGVYDYNTGELLACGPGGGKTEKDINDYSDIMNVKNVTYLQGIQGTQWKPKDEPTDESNPLLQKLYWTEENEGSSEDKELGRNEDLITKTTTFTVKDEILGVIVYCSAPNFQGYVSSMKFVYK
ncbi:MAG: hypothetical protein ACK5NL_04830, partial [Vibrio fluvialis]